MSLIKDYVNPLNILDARRLDFIPEHFAIMTIGVNPHESFQNMNNIDFWIYQNLSSRYSIRQVLKINSDNKTIKVHELGMEDPKELTILSLMCPYLNK